MPSVNFRMTEDERAALAADASSNSRSIQREIYHRVFRQGGSGDTHHGSSDTGASTPVLTKADLGAASPRGASAPARPFRGPDLKPNEKKGR